MKNVKMNKLLFNFKGIVGKYVQLPLDAVSEVKAYCRNLAKISRTQRRKAPDKLSPRYSLKAEHKPDCS
jgi:hypothetical protein